MYFAFFCMCVYLYLFFFLSQIVYTSYSYTNSWSFLLSSLRGWISSPRTWRSHHGHKHRRTAATEQSGNLGLQDGIRSPPHQHYSSFHPPSFAKSPVQTFTPAVLTLLTKWQRSPFSTRFSLSSSKKRHHFLKVKSWLKEKVYTVGP